MKANYVMFACVLCLVALQGLALAQEEVTIHFFWREGCPHCADEKPFLASLEDKYPELKVMSYDVSVAENSALYAQMSATFNVTPAWIPATFVGDYPPIIGFDNVEGTGKKIEELVLKCIDKLCYGSNNASNQTSVVDIPFIGEIDITQPSLPALTVMLGFADGFNPCAFFVLYSLLSLLVYAGSRKRMLLIGGIFVMFSAVMYFMMMALWLNVFNTIGNPGIIAIIAGLIALVVALVNIKDYFFFKKGVSFTMSDKAKAKVFTRMRNLLKAESIFSMLVGTIILAVLVNMYELACTFGFPSFFTQELARRGIEVSSQYLYMLVYCTVYIIPLLAIVLSFTLARGSRKMTESQGRKLKLVSGMMMLFLGVSLLLYPTMLENVLLSIMMLVSAVVIALVIAWISDKHVPGKRRKDG